MREAFAGALGIRYAFGRVEMPADRLAVVLELDGDVVVRGAVDEPVVADGVVAVELEMDEVDDERVAGLGALNVEGPGFGVTALDALDAVHVGAARVYGGGVDGVAGRDGQDRLVERRELAVVDGRGEFVTLRRAVFEHRRGCRGEGVLQRMRLVGGVGFDGCAGDDSVLDGRVDVGGDTAITGGQQMEAGSVDLAVELVAGIGAGELVAFLLQLHREIGRRPEDVGGHDPFAGKAGLWLLRETGDGERRERQRIAKKGLEAHAESPGRWTCEGGVSLIAFTLAGLESSVLPKNGVGERAVAPDRCGRPEFSLVAFGCKAEVATEEGHNVVLEAIGDSAGVGAVVDLE